ncbi:MAG: hypothetical protein U5L00_18170 [Desulfovermiculus sp.]|nr:hypothetical protein [Desulfovermiculus sp.]
MIKEAEKTIISALKENDAHVQRLQRAKGLLAEFFPLTVESFTGLRDEQIEHIDQFIYRFTKLQDSMGKRLLPAIYAWLESDNRPRPFMDVLNRLEQLGVIDDVNLWQFFRNLRNNLAHDYPESIDQTVETLNLLFADIDKMLDMYSHVRSYWVSRSGKGDYSNNGS